MNRAYNANNIPKYYALLLVFAFIPQLVTNNSYISLLLKVIVILTFGFVFFFSEKTYLQLKDVVYILILILNILVPAFYVGGDTIQAIQELVIGVFTFFIFYLVPRRTSADSSEGINHFFCFFSYFILVSCVYNMIINFNGLLRLTSLSVYSSYEIKSFFDNKNTFGFFLTFGIFASILMSTRTNERKWAIFIILMFVNELMSMCRTAIVVSSILIAASLLVNASHYQKNRLLIIIAAVFFALLMIVSDSFYRFITNNLFGSTFAVEARKDYVFAMFPQVQGVHRLIGYGNTGASSMLKWYSGAEYFHNSFLEAYVSGGLTRVTILIYWIINAVYTSYRIRYFDKSVGNVCITSAVIYVVYSFSESIQLFSSTLISMTATVFVVAMPQFIYRSFLNEQRLAG